MKRIFNKIILGLAVVTMSTSCEDFLTQNDPTSLNTETYWRNLKDCDAGLVAAYSGLRNHFIYNFGTEAVRSDMGWPGYGRPTSQSAAGLVWYQHTYTSSQDEINNKWDACYKVIFRANQVIAGLEKIKDNYTDEENIIIWQNKMGEARFLRGLMHFYLYNAFNNGSIMIFDTVAKKLDDIYLRLSPAEDVLTFIRKDLDYAYQNLPYTQELLGRATKGAAATILGTSYLYNNEYDEAAKLFADVIENPEYGYELVTDMSLLFTTAGEFNAESIFEVEYNLTHHTEIATWQEDGMTNRWAFYCGSGSAGCSLPAWLAYEYSHEAMDPKDNRNYIGGVLRNVPLRCSAMAAVVNDTQTPYYDAMNPVEGAKVLTKDWGFGWHKKYTNHDLGISVGDDKQRSGKNVTLNRLADVYLMLAECKINSESNVDIEGALSLINKVRARWGLCQLGAPISADYTYDGIDYTAESLMKHLMYIERPLELSVEGHMTRWLDLRRWGVLKDRFEDLASRVYYGNNYTFVNSEGANQTVTQNYLTNDNPIDPDPAKHLKIDFEYDGASAAYLESSHAYYPIPSKEIINNPNL